MIIQRLLFSYQHWILQFQNSFFHLKHWQIVASAHSTSNEITHTCFFALKNEKRKHKIHLIILEKLTCTILILLICGIHHQHYDRFDINHYFCYCCLKTKLSTSFPSFGKLENFTWTCYEWLICYVNLLAYKGELPCINLFDVNYCFPHNFSKLNFIYN